jgi:hypothetical protein
MDMKAEKEAEQPPEAGGFASSSRPRSTNTQRGRVAPERVTIERAEAILGVANRTVQGMSERGEIPGAAKIGRRWTYDVNKLRGYVRTKERETWHAPKHRQDVTGTLASSTAKSKSKANESDGRYGQIIQRLRGKPERLKKPVR